MYSSLSPVLLLFVLGPCSLLVGCNLALFCFFLNCLILFSIFRSNFSSSSSSPYFLNSCSPIWVRKRFFYIFFLSTFLLFYFSVFPLFYLSTFQHFYSSTFLLFYFSSFLLFFLFTFLLLHFSTFLLSHFSSYLLSTFLLFYLSTFQHFYSSTFLLFYFSTGRLKKSSHVCLFYISGTNEQISKPLISYEN